MDVQLDFIVDTLTNSIEKVSSGERFDTEVLSLVKDNLTQVTKKNGWKFNWKLEFNDPRKEVYKLISVQMPDVIQGLLSISIEADHVYMNLLESAPFNIGQTKEYQGVAGNLVAFACKRSFECGFDGNVAFTAKTKLIQHYIQTLGACIIAGQRMAILEREASFLINKYYNS
jgi:hypothetical protein